MKLQEQVNNDLKQAIINKDEVSKSILKVVVSEFSRHQFKELSDDIALNDIRIVAKGLVECGNTIELAVISKYLPTKLTDTELIIKIDDIINNNNIDLSDKKSIGIIMSQLKSQLGNLYDGKQANEIIQTKLL